MLLFEISVLQNHGGRLFSKAQNCLQWLFKTHMKDQLQTA